MSDMGDLARHTGIKWNNAEQTVGTVEYGNGDRGQTAMFFLDRVHNPGKSREEGHPIYDNVPFVRIGPPGERLNIVIRPANDVDRRRFALQWAQFQQNVEQRPSGTPLSILYPENPAVTGMLEGSNVFTVEQLSDLSANAIENIGMGAQKYVNEAQQYLKMAEKGVKNTEFRRQLEDRDNKIATLQMNVQELNNTVTKLLAQMKDGTLRQGEVDYASQQERPTHQRRVAFDPQAEQIAATGRATRVAPKKQADASQKRVRPRLTD
jgi:hypothetical protein